MGHLRGMRGRRRAVLAVVAIAFGGLAAGCVPEPPPPAPRCDLGAPDGGTRYAFLVVHNGCPARWSSCRPVSVQWWYNPTGERVSVSEVQAGVAQVSAATGLTFEYMGTTTVVPSAYTGFGGFGVVIGWESIGTAGIAQPSWVSNDAGTALYFRGNIRFNTNATSIPPAAWTQIILHELGHLVGLNHVSDPNQVMHPVSMGDFAKYQPGDLEGLRFVGAAQGCR